MPQCRVRLISAPCNEVKKLALNRVYHNNSTCPVGCNVKAARRHVWGKNNYRLCRDCDERNGPDREAPHNRIRLPDGRAVFATTSATVKPVACTRRPFP